MQETAEHIARDVALVAKIDAVPTILEVVCRTTGMGLAVVVRVSEDTWTACAVKDDIQFGLEAGGQLDLKTTLCYEVRASRKAITIDHASVDPTYQNHHTPKLYNIESYISVPIIRANGEYFGNLCAIDPRPAHVSDPKVVALFEGFAQLIALQLDSQMLREKEHKLLLDEQAAVELREQFIAILGHDLRNPLQSIFAGAELLARKYKDDEAVSNIGRRITTSARRMSQLIDDVLDFARGRLGSGIGIQVASVDNLENALVGVVEELQDGYPDRQIILNVSVERAVSCDVGRIQQLASNLIANALNHGAPDRAVEVTVREGDGAVVLEVWNAGEPIPPEAMTKIFDPFWRQSTAADRQGLGLGLHISSQIVRAHHGELLVTSTAAEGTRFTAILPLAAAAVAGNEVSAQ